MAHPFDAANKFMLKQFPADWIALGGLPPGSPCIEVDADLSVVSKAADKLVKVTAPEPYVAHVEFQASADSQLDLRVLVYNSLARQQLGLPVHSVVFLLRPQALSPWIIGYVKSEAGTDHRLEFRYKLVRVWELPVETLLNGGIGTLPLAPLSSVHQRDLPGVVEAMKRRIDAEVRLGMAHDLWTATRVLMGLRFPDTVSIELFKGVMQMRESAGYQAILEEGRVEEARKILERGGVSQFGPLNQETRTRIEAITKIRKLEKLLDRIIAHDAKSWEDLLD